MSLRRCLTRNGSEASCFSCLLQNAVAHLTTIRQSCRRLSEATRVATFVDFDNDSVAWLHGVLPEAERRASAGAPHTKRYSSTVLSDAFTSNAM